MKVLELTRSFYPSIGGMEKFVSDRLKIYKSLSIDFNVLSTSHTEKQIKDSKKLEYVKYLKSYTPYGIVPELKKVLKQEYDILSVNQVGYFYSDFAIKVAFQNEKKIILTPHFYFHTNKYKTFKNFHYKWVLPNTLSKIDKMICFTNYEAIFWSKNFPQLENKIEIIPHYFESPKILVENEGKLFGNYFLFLGRGEKNKRIDLLVRSFDKIKTDYQLVLTLNNDELSPLLNKIVSANKRIHLLGRVSEEKKQNLLANCSALILPSDFEAFGIVAFEASYHKKPLMLSNLGVFKEIHENSGVMYFDNSLDSLIEVIRQFIKENHFNKTRRGMDNFENLYKYSFEKISEKYSKVFSTFNF